jgi:acetyltransferase-like isoleucine patch superfamily enzyme
MPGVTIGAGSVVTADQPPHCLALGNPCRVQRSIEDVSADRAA